ncbi:MAG: ECF-type sigma factor [Acidobacteriota bacterium]
MRKDFDESPDSGGEAAARGAGGGAEREAPYNATLVPLVYAELRALAHRYLQGESRRRPIQTTALVHEAYVRLAEKDVECKDRNHFVAIAATTMRRVLVDLARERASHKRGAGAIHLPLDDQLVGSETRQADVLALDQVMRRLEQHDPRKARVVEMRVFGGLTVAQTAEALGIGRATVERDLRFAKAWLGRELKSPAPAA